MAGAPLTYSLQQSPIFTITHQSCNRKNVERTQVDSSKLRQWKLLNVFHTNSSGLWGWLWGKFYIETTAEIICNYFTRISLSKLSCLYRWFLWLPKTWISLTSNVVILHYFKTTLRDITLLVVMILHTPPTSRLAVVHKVISVILTWERLHWLCYIMLWANVLSIRQYLYRAHTMPMRGRSCVWGPDSVSFYVPVRLHVTVLVTLVTLHAWSLVCYPEQSVAHQWQL